MPNEIRQDPVTKRWTIYAPDRNNRPKDTPTAAAAPSSSSHCPFCPGREDQLPGILMETPGLDDQPWQTRIVPNKYAALTPEADGPHTSDGLFCARAAYGHHEVVIETPHHHQDLPQMSPEAVQAVIETYLRRYHELRRRDPSLYPLIFRNHGSRSGASLRHPHSQIVATPLVPQQTQWCNDAARQYFERTGRCVYCDMSEEEQRVQRRVVLENASFVVFVPFAAEVPYELWIVPRQHRADVGDTADAEAADLADALRTTLARLHDRLGDPDYNYVIQTAPDYRSQAPHLHWYLRIVPRTIDRGGFEVGSGIRINPSLPEMNADDLR